MKDDSDDLVLICSCSHLHHAVRFTFSPYCPGEESWGFEAYVDVSLMYEQSWWGRLKTAIRYLRCRTCGYEDVSEITLRDDDLPKLRAWVDRAIAEAAKRER